MRARRGRGGPPRQKALTLASAGTPGWARAGRESGFWVLHAGGRWTLSAAESLAIQLARFEPERGAKARIDLSALELLDSAGAWLLFRFMRRLEHEGLGVEIVGQTPAQAALIERMKAVMDERKPLARKLVPPIRAMVERVGHATFSFFERGQALISFFGVTAIVLMHGLLHPSRLRLIAFASHVERIGLDALPIVGLLSFLIGVVLAYQGADQLRAYGAEIFTVNLLGVSVLRELGVLLTAIMVAGRSGSAFTAEIGTMQVNQEVDALKTLGIDPVEILVLPRLLAMMVALPLLAFFSNVMALLGGALMSLFILDISLSQFLTQFREAITITMFWVGIVKAPFFAFLIAMVGCYEGLRVEGSAESVGRLTTKSVVEAIFLVIVADAAFSIFFSYLGV